MSESTATTWACDRCGRIQKLGLNQQPIKWARLYLASPPKSAEKQSSKDLCEECKKAVSDFILNPRRWQLVPTPEPTTQPPREDQIQETVQLKRELTEHA